MARPRTNPTVGATAPPIQTTAPKRKPRVDVLERRLQNPFGEPSAPIDLTDRSMSCRIFNREANNQRIYAAKQAGWEPVTLDDLAEPDQAAGFRLSTDGRYLVRGEREQEVLMKMPTDWRKQIALAKTKQNIANMRPGAMKKEAAEAAGRHVGSEAAEFIDKNVKIVGDVTDQREIVQQMPEEIG